MPRGSIKIMMNLMLIKLAVTFLCFNTHTANAHGRLLEPPMRASVWRFKEFEKLNPPTNYDDDAFWCGGLETQYQINGGKCGVCGDDYRDAVPRSHEDGGTYGRGIIVRNYTRGQTIPVSVYLTGAHNGRFQFSVCPRNSRSDPETESCHESNMLELGNGKAWLPASTRKGYYNTTATLPTQITCSRCSLRWEYKAGNQWGQCANGTFDTGCGNQETFRGCADVSIV